MHPLLVSAVAGTAGNLLDRWTRSSGASPAVPATDFQQMLDGKTSTAGRTVEKTPAERALERLAKLRTELFEAPEVRAVLDSADPTKPAAISLTPDGRLLFAPPGRDPKAILLAPETAEIARELATLAALRGPVPFSPPTLPRPASYDLTPQTGITALR